jgi:putative transcriptional regulator
VNAGELIGTINMLHSVSKGLLIAMPTIKDDFFEKTVILMIEHGDEGAFGLVLNRKTIHEASLVTKQFGLKWSSLHPSLYKGGPVHPSGLWILHPDEYQYAETITLCEGVATSRSKDALTALVEEKEPNIKLLVGCAAWTPGQLENELISGYWLLASVNEQFIFDVPSEELWETVIRSLGFEPSQLSIPEKETPN